MFTRIRQLESQFYLQNQSKLADIDGSHLSDERRRNRSSQNPTEPADIRVYVFNQTGARPALKFHFRQEFLLGEPQVIEFCAMA
jgi:hypothetical protein